MKQILKSVWKFNKLNSCKFLDSKIKKNTKFIDDFDTFEIDNEKFEDIRQHLTILNGNLSRKLSGNKDSIIGGKEYTFEFKEIDIKSLFGSFKETEKVI